MNQLERRAEDEQMLTRALAENLATPERDAFADMQEKMRSGERVTLSAAQRAWVDKALDRFVPQYENLVSSGRVPIKPSSRKFEFETMAKPLRPPARRGA